MALAGQISQVVTDVLKLKAPPDFAAPLETLGADSMDLATIETMLVRNKITAGNVMKNMSLKDIIANAKVLEKPVAAATAPVAAALAAIDICDKKTPAATGAEPLSSLVAKLARADLANFASDTFHLWILNG